MRINEVLPDLVSEPSKKSSLWSEVCPRIIEYVAHKSIHLYIWDIYSISVRYMVQAMINISEDANQILNIVKARYNLKDKSEAIEKVVLSCGGELLEPELRPEFIKKIEQISKEKTIKIGTLENFRKRYGLN